MWSLVWPLLRSWLLRRGLGLLGWLAAAATVLAVLLGARRAGRKAERIERLQHYARICSAQLNAASTRPRSRGHLSRIMREGTF